MAEYFSVSIPANSALSSRAIYQRLLSWVKPYWRFFLLSVVAMVLTAATEPMFPALMKYLLDNGFSAKAVSYTHLDVYKRQSLRCNVRIENIMTADAAMDSFTRLTPAG